MKLIAHEGGLLIYFYEEGRGAGLRIKMEAISLEQTLNYNTKKAYECLYVNPDERNDYTIVGEIVYKIFNENIKFRLLTNNPRKTVLIRNAGVNISSIEPLICVKNPRQKKYLEDKEKFLDHMIRSVHLENEGDDLDTALSGI
jgi:GTP cyclohydrolase II